MSPMEDCFSEAGRNRGQRQPRHGSAADVAKIPSEGMSPQSFIFWDGSRGQPVSDHERFIREVGRTMSREGNVVEEIFFQACCGVVVRLFDGPAVPGRKLVVARKSNQMMVTAPS